MEKNEFYGINRIYVYPYFITTTNIDSISIDRTEIDNICFIQYDILQIFSFIKS